MMNAKSNAPSGGTSSTRRRDARGSTTVDTDEGVLSNPNGRSIPDASKTKSNLISCKHAINVATMNVRTIRLESRRKELANNCKTQKVKILGIVDHKIVHEDEPIVYQHIDKQILITTSAWRTASNAASGGVGLMIDKSIESALSEVKPVDKRILIAEFNGNPRTTIIVHYAPVEGSGESDEHYDTLCSVIQEVPKHNLLLVLGDYNAHLGKEVGKYTYHDKTNSNGKRLLDMSQEAGLVITNIHKQKKSGKLWTYISDMSGTKSQVDFILVNSKWKNSVKNCEAYSSFSSMGSDHRIVSAKIKLSLRTSKSPQPEPRYDWSALKDPEINRLYTVAVKNRYESLCQEGQTITETYAHLITANEEAASEHLPRKKSGRKKKIVAQDPRVEEARKQVQYASSIYTTKPSEKNREKLCKSKSNLQEIYNLIEEEELGKAIREVEEANEKSRHGKSWKLINELTGRKKAKTGIIKGATAKERLDKWYSHFQGLLGKEPEVEGELDENIPPILHSLGISDSPFTHEEYKELKKSLIEGKQYGPDKIPPEVWKLCDLDDIMLSYANKLLLGEKPDQWSENNLLPIPKDGDLSDTNNYRGIALSAVAAKIANKLILNRIRPKIDKYLRTNQNGFRPGRSTIAHILCLRRLIEGVKRNNLKCIVIFIDFRKAFDSIHRGRMMTILKAYGIPGKLLTAINQMYTNTKARVLSPDGETEWFEILAGVLQGDTLAPYLFAIVLDYAMRKALEGREDLGFELEKRRSRRHPPVTITDTDFADDIALISEEIEQAQEMLTCVETETLRIGLHLNEKKTEVMAFGPIPLIKIKTKNGKELKYVVDFKYLGGRMVSSEKDLEIRKALAWSACNKLKTIWKSNLKKGIKKRLFLSTVESVLLYGAETWTINKKMEKRLDGCYTRMLRMAFNVSWKDRMTNEELYDGLPKLSTKIATRRMKLAGHCIRHPEEEASKLVLWEPEKGVRNVGRGTVSYIDNLIEDTGLATPKEIRTAMMDRKGWKERSEGVRARGRP